MSTTTRSSAYLDARPAVLRVEYEAIIRNGFPLQLDCPDLALERHISFADQPLAAFIAFVESVVGTINRALGNIPRDRMAAACAGATTKGRTIRTCR